MKRRLLVAILGVTAVAIVLFGVPLVLVIRRLVNEDATIRLEREAILATRFIPDNFTSGADPVELPANTKDIAIALYDRDGNLITGSGPLSADDFTLQALTNEVVDGEVAEALIVAVPVATNEVVVGAIRAEQPTATVDARVLSISLSLSSLAVLVLVVGASIGWVVSDRLTRPVLRLRDAAVRLGDGDFAVNIPGSNVPELDEAARAMTATARRLDNLLARERMFSADVSHQLRTPLAGLRAGLETELEYPRSDSSAILREGLVDLDRLERTISDLLAMARSRDSSDASFDLVDVFEDFATEWDARYAEGGRTLAIDSPRFVPRLRGNAAALHHALHVLVENSLQHGDGQTRIAHLVNDDTVTLRISDEGQGFGPVKPFDSEDEIGTNGDLRGFGLPLAKRLIESMPGRIILTSIGAHPRIDIILERADRSAPHSDNGS